MSRPWLMAVGLALLMAVAGLVFFSDLLTGLARYAAELQSTLNRELARELRGVKQGGLMAGWGLVALGFGYGVLHTLGPGHGKAVVVAYFLDPGRRMGWLDGMFAGAWIAITHTVSAIAMVAVLYAITRPTALRAIGDARSIELVSYALILAIGLWRLYAGITGKGHDHAHDHGHGHGHAHGHGHDHGHAHGHGHDHGDARVHDHAHGHDAAHNHAHDHAHGAGHGHGHDHALTNGHRHDHGHASGSPSLLARLKRFLVIGSGLGLLTAAGIAPCAGAVVLMLLAVALDVMWAGVLGVLAIASGMAITLSAIGIASMLAHRLLIGDRPSAAIGRLTTIGAALVVVATGGFMLAGALYRAFAP